MAHTAAHLNAESFWWWQCSEQVLDIKTIPDPPTSPSLISLNGFCGRKASCFQNAMESAWPFLLGCLRTDVIVFVPSSVKAQKHVGLLVINMTPYWLLWNKHCEGEKPPQGEIDSASSVADSTVNNLQGQCHSKGSYAQSMTVSTVSSELLILLLPNLVWVISKMSYEEIWFLCSRSRSRSQQNFKMSVNAGADDIFWTAEPFITKRGMVMHQHEPECISKRSVCCL